MAQEARDVFIVAAPGLEKVTAAETAALGIGGRAEAGGVSLRGSPDVIMRANLHLRTASRVLVRVAEFRARSFIELERHARRIDWSPWVRPGGLLSFRVTSKKSKLYHEGGIAERFARWMAEDFGTSPMADAEDAQRIVIRVHRDVFQVSIDSSGRHLRFRGYREALARAPLRENIAAALLLASGWKGDGPLLDPFCGSGTIPIEAALLARRIAPGIATAGRGARAYAFQAWPGYREDVWERMVEEARRSVLDRSPVPIVGSDRDAGAIVAARSNAQRAGVTDDVDWQQAAISSAATPGEKGHLVTNPPYGVRVGEEKKLADLYAAFAKLAGSRWAGWTIGMLAASDPLLRRARMGLDPELRTRNGGIDVKFVVRPPLAVPPEA